MYMTINNISQRLKCNQMTIQNQNWRRVKAIMIIAMNFYFAAYFVCRNRTKSQPNGTLNVLIIWSVAFFACFRPAPPFVDLVGGVFFRPAFLRPLFGYKSNRILGEFVRRPIYSKWMCKWLARIYHLVGAHCSPLAIARFFIDAISMFSLQHVVCVITIIGNGESDHQINVCF